MQTISKMWPLVFSDKSNKSSKQIMLHAIAIIAIVSFISFLHLSVRHCIFVAYQNEAEIPVMTTECVFFALVFLMNSSFFLVIITLFINLDTNQNKIHSKTKSDANNREKQLLIRFELRWRISDSIFKRQKIKQVRNKTIPKKKH